jgi:hypothetical protein
MAGHLPIIATKFHEGLKLAFVRNPELNRANHFDKIEVEGYGGYFQKLPTDEYEMSCETGLHDIAVFSFTPDDGNDVHEVHLGRAKDFKIIINQVYLVM